ncbi:MAG: DUF2961 domain-containing protein [Armatimonadetes bacterium]|nr:DUF2961 domain-containing protein [Armatimonadota bacterium]
MDRSRRTNLCPKVVGAVLAAGLSGAGHAQIDVNSLIQEVSDMSRLYSRASEPYKMIEASSFDRRSISQDRDTWFANDDFGNYVYTIDRNGRREYVMLDAKGPGSIVRMWSANPAGTVRFYFDGSSLPKITASFDDFVSGKVKPMGAPFGYVAGKGHNLYFPIPFAKSLIVTIDASKGAKPQNLYYQINWRKYRSGTEVTSLPDSSIDQKQLSLVGDSLKKPRKALLDEVSRPIAETRGVSLMRGSNGRFILGSGSPGLVKEFSFKLDRKSVGDESWSDPAAWQHVLRNVILSIETDGTETAKVPLGDFFGGGLNLSPFETVTQSIDKDGWMRCRLPVPYEKGLVFRLNNYSGVDLTATGQFKQGDLTISKPYALHAQFLSEVGSSQPKRDLSIAKLTGEGNYVGTSILCGNNSRAWWGEGDEKIFVDGESAPSSFGTGTEDYFGYAWSSPEAFTAPYHAQTRVGGPENLGYFANNRFHILDSMPFTSGLEFRLEMWHWAETPIRLDRVAFWYGPKDQNPPPAIDLKKLALKEIK